MTKLVLKLNDADTGKGLPYAAGESGVKNIRTKQWATPNSGRPGEYTLDDVQVGDHIEVTQPRYVERQELTWSSSGFSPSRVEIERRYHMKGRLLKGKFVFGVNLAWLDGGYGHDLGRNHVPTTSAPCTFNLNHLEAYFNHISDSGFKVIRFWVFEGLEGLLFSDAQGKVIGIDDDMKTNVPIVMERASSAGLKLYWCIFDSWVDPTSRLQRLIKDSDSRESFITNGLVEFFDLIPQAYKNNVFAIDLINEPEGLVGHGGVTWQHMMQYITEATKASRDAGFRCSVGFQKLDTIKGQQGNAAIKGLDFYDFHKYDDNGTIPPFWEQGFDKPCIIGEFGQDCATNNIKQTDNVQKNADRQFMRNAWRLGYAGCLVWYYNWPRYNPFELDSNGKLESKHNLLQAQTPPPSDLNGLKQIERPVWDEIRNFAQRADVKPYLDI